MSSTSAWRRRAPRPPPLSSSSVSTSCSLWSRRAPGARASSASSAPACSPCTWSSWPCPARAASSSSRFQTRARSSSSFSGLRSQSASSGSPTTASSRCGIGRPDPPGYDGVMAVSTSSSLDSAALRADFPFLEERVDGKPLAYLDSASSTQKPRQVLDRMRSFYEHEYANVHRGVYRLAERATEGYEGARTTVSAFINAPSEREVIFTRSSTEAINLVAYAWGLQNLGPGDTVVITELEHHANFVPWQFIASKTGASFRHIPIDDAGELQLDALEALARGGSIKVVATGLVSNSLGTINPIAHLAAWAHEQGAIMVVDAAQAAPHRTIDVQALGCDFLAFSSHKLCGPSGIGALWGRAELLEVMEPFNLGGEMIRSVGLDRTTFNEIPFFNDAGTT